LTVDIAPLVDINVASSSFPANFLQVGDQLFFTADDGINGNELWKSDGSASGTSLVKDINPGSSSSNPTNLRVVGNTLYFSALDPLYGRELWKSDGTPEGTSIVKDIRTSNQDSNPQTLVNVNGTLFFTASTFTHGTELWKSDGTEQGTVLLKDIRPGSEASTPQFLTNVNGTLYFGANNGVDGIELWKSDGTEAGTVMVRDIRAGTSGSNLSALTNVNGTLFFSANDIVIGQELWKTDGTLAGTVPVRDIESGEAGSQPLSLVNVDGTLYFTAITASTGRELWKSDGTLPGTVLVKDIRSGTLGSLPSGLVSLAGVVYFSATDSLTGTELWRSDGTNAGTAIVKDIRPNSSSSSPVGFTAMGDKFYFRANDGVNGAELWSSDGTAAGTVLVRNIANAGESSTPNLLTAVGSKLFFTATTATSGWELYVLDETPAAPTSILISSNVVPEDRPVGTTVGVLSTAGSLPATTTFEIVGGGIGLPFTLVGNEIRTNATLDYEIVSFYSIPIQATSGGVTITRDISIFIGPVNEFDPQLTSPLVYSIPENTSHVVNLSATDLDSPLPSFSYSIVGGADSGRFTIAGNRLSFATPPNFEVPADADGNNEYIVQIAVSDGSRSQTSTLVVSVTDVNEAPTNITLSNLTFAESLPAGSVVGTLAATDADGPDPISFAFAAITPNNNVDFEIVGNQLRTTREFDFETPADQQLLVRIVASDALSATSLPTVFHITVTDAPERPIASNLTLNTNRNNGIPVTLGGDVATPIFAITQHPRHGTLSGTIPNLTYLPSSNFVGEDEFFYTVSSNGLTSFEARVAITVIGVKPTANFSFGGLGVAESSGTVNLRVNLSEPAEQDLVVSFQIQPGGTATEGLDFYAPQSVLIKRNESFGFTTLTIIDDPVDELLENFTIAIVASPEYILGSMSTLPVTISDNDDPPVISWTVNSLTVTESAGTVSAKIRLNAPATQDIIIPFTVGGTATGSDFGPVTPAGSTITIPSGQTEAIFSIPITNDDQPEATETIVIELGTPNYGQISSLLSDRRFTLTVRDDDLAEISMMRSLVTVGENAGTIQVTATINVAQATTLTVPFDLGGNATLGGISADYTISSPTAFVFQPGSLNASVTIFVIDDNVVESVPENIELVLRVPTGNSPAYKVGSQSRTIVTVVDNDSSVLSFAKLTDEIWESQSSYTFSVNLTKPLQQALTVPLGIPSGRPFATRGVDYVFTANSITIPAGQLSATATVTIINDALNESNELLRIVFGAMPATAPVFFGANRSLTITIKDNDPLLSIVPVISVRKKASVTEGGIVEFDLVLSAVSNFAVTANVALSGTATYYVDYSKIPGGPFFPIFSGLPANVNVPVQAIIPAGTQSVRYKLQTVNDSAAEDNETITASLYSVVNGVPSTRTTATATIVDNDLAGVRFDTTSASISETRITNRKLFNTTFSNRTQTVTVTMDTVADRDVYAAIAFGGTATYGKDYRVLGLDAKRGLLLKAGWKQATFTIEILHDTVYEGDERITAAIVAVSSPGVQVRPTPAVTFTIIDDDKPSGSSSGFGLWDGQSPVVSSNQPLTIAGSGTLAIDTAGRSPLIGVFPFPNAGVSGVAIDGSIFKLPVGVGTVLVGTNGPIEGGRAFFDANFNGILDYVDLNANGVQDEDDLDEIFVETAADGSFTIFLDDFDLDQNGFIDPGEGRFVLSGGKDISTGLDWRIPLTAPVGIFNLTPLSTLAESLVRTQLMTVEQAALRATAAMGVSDYDITRGTSIYEVLDNDASAARAYSAHVQLYSAVFGIAQFFAGATGRDVTPLGSIIFDQVAELVAEDTAELDLANPGVLYAIIDSLMQSQAIENVDVARIESMANAVARGIASLQIRQVNEVVSGQVFLTEVNKTKKVVQGVLPDDLYLLGSGDANVTTQYVDLTYSASALTALIAQQTGDVTVPPVAFIDSLGIMEGNSGTQTLVFSVQLVGDHPYAVSLDYTTSDGSAIADEDYVSTNGTLTWLAGDNDTKFISVTINGDQAFESDEFFRVLLSNANRLVVRQSEGRGFIINDDSAVFSASTETLENEFLLTLSNMDASVNENGIELLNGPFQTPINATINGQNAADDDLIIDFSANTYRSDHWIFDGGVGGADKLIAQAGVFTSVNYRLIGPKDARMEFVPSSVNDRVTLHAIDVESSRLLLSTVDQLVVQVPATVGNLIIEDADGADVGVMRIRSTNGSFAPIEFTNPTGSIRLVLDSPGTTVNELSRDADFSGTIDVTFSDVTKPVSSVSPLPTQATSLSFVVTATGTDPNGSEGSASGLKEYDLYVSSGGAFTKFATVPAGSPTTTFTGSANTTYWFRSLGRDNSGNVETKISADTYTRIGDVVPPSTQVTTAVPTSSGLFTVQMTGNKPTGTPITAFDVYVVIDGGEPILVGAASSVATGGGNYSGVILFQGILDGVSRTYRFYSRGRDGSGNVEAAPVSGDVSATYSFASAGLTATAIDVQNGVNQRSYVRYLDVLFSTSTGLVDLLATGRVKVERFGINATSVTPESGTAVTGLGLVQNGNKLRLDFGLNGLGGLRQAGNGFYRILLDLDGNGMFTDAGDKAFEFHRLFGDANGDAKVDVADTNLVTSQIGRIGANLDGDLDGNGSVNSTDRLYTTQQRGQQLLAPLLSWLDD
jgi:ELWxxDGT repeat protein